MKQSIKLQNEFKFSDDIPQIYPHLKLPVKEMNSLLIYAVNESPFETGTWSAQTQTSWHPPTFPPNGHSPLVPQGEWPTWSKPGKWHKWAMQLFINMWHHLQWLFTNMYICHLITYSCTKSIKMLWGLFLPLTNLLISLHQQSHVLLHQGTTFIH